MRPQPHAQQQQQEKQTTNRRWQLV